MCGPGAETPVVVEQEKDSYDKFWHLVKEQEARC